MLKSDFSKIINDNYRLTTLHVYYYIPDHTNLINLFLWQTYDEIPKLVRINKFLNHWKENIKAPIQTIEVGYDDIIKPCKFNKADFIVTIN